MKFIFSVLFIALMTAASLTANAAKESCGLDDRFHDAKDFVTSRKLAQSEAQWACQSATKKAVRVSAWRDLHSDGQDCERDPIDGNCVPGSIMYAPVNQSCADFVCR